MKHIPQTRITIPNQETICTPYFEYSGPLGLVLGLVVNLPSLGSGKAEIGVVQCEFNVKARAVQESYNAQRVQVPNIFLTLVPKPILLMVFGTRDMQYWVLGPSTTQFQSQGK